MGTVSDLVTEIQTAGGFDVTAAEALTVLDRRHKLMCGRATWHRVSEQVTVVTGASDAYSTIDLPSGAVEVFSVEVPGASASLFYQRTPRVDRSAMVAGTLRLSGGGVFVESDPVTGVSPAVTSLILYPAATDGVEASVDGAWLPPTLTTAELVGAFVRVPEDLHEGLLAGCYASLLNRPSEGRPDLAGVQEQLFSAACSELRTRAERRYRTRGTRQIRVAGRNI
jgi:hypothetical protein